MEFRRESGAKPEQPRYCNRDETAYATVIGREGAELGRTEVRIPAENGHVSHREGKGGGYGKSDCPICISLR